MFFFSSFITRVKNQYFLVDVVFMERCNYSTVSQAILASLHNNSLDLNDAWAVVTDNATYCLKRVMPNSIHVTCLCHIINLVGDTWQHYKYFSDATWAAFLINKECVQAKVPSEAVSTRWNSWFGAVKCHAEHVHLYRQFLLAESTGMAVRNILSQLETGDGADPHSQANLHFRNLLQTNDIPDHPGGNSLTYSSDCIQCHGGSWLLTSFNGTAKTSGYGPKKDEQLRKMGVKEEKNVLDNLHDAFHLSYTKFLKHWDTHPARGWPGSLIPDRLIEH